VQQLEITGQHIAPYGAHCIGVIMIIYVLKNEAGEYLCYDTTNDVMCVAESFKRALTFATWQKAKEHADWYSNLGKFDLYRWIIMEEKDEE
jgi:hypothetical protein